MSLENDKLLIDSLPTTMNSYMHDGLETLYVPRWLVKSWLILKLKIMSIKEYTIYIPSIRCTTTWTVVTNACSCVHMTTLWMHNNKLGVYVTINLWLSSCFEKRVISFFKNTNTILLTIWKLIFDVLFLHMLQNGA